MNPNQPRAGWESQAARKVEARSFARLLGTLTDPEKALLRSQGGPLASAPFISMPIDRVSRIDSQSFRLLFLRRLRQPLPLTVRSCRCGHLLDCLGHHRSACPVAGVLGRLGTVSSKLEENSSKKHFHPKTLSSKTISSKTEDNFIHDTFIQKRFHPMTVSSKNGFVQRHFRPKPVSSNDTFIQNHFHPNPFHPKPLSSQTQNTEP